MRSSALVIAAVIACISGSTSLVGGQTQSTPASTSSTNVSAEYPRNGAGILVQNSDWLPLVGVTPFKSRMKHGIAASMSYGAVPATIVSEYEGLHASVQITATRPIICICHLISLPGEPVLVRLHPKKTTRELDGGRMRVLPVVGGSKMAKANESDLVPIDVSQPEVNVWLVQPHEPLEAGEYALMLGRQNVDIFPFTATGTSSQSATETDKQ